MNSIDILFKAGNQVYLIGTLGLYDVSNMTEEELIEFKKPFVESFKNEKAFQNLQNGSIKIKAA